MKKTISLLTAIIMVFSLITIPVTAGTSAFVAETAETLDEALNIEGGMLHFEPVGSYTFVIDEECAKTNNQGVANSVASVRVQGIDTAEVSVLHFNYKVSSEANWDKFKVIIDGNSVFDDSGDKSDSWLKGSVIIPQGAGEIMFAYSKDGSSDRYSDTVWLDDVYAAPYIDVAGVEFALDAVTIDINATQQLVWSILPENAANINVSFASADTGVATVNRMGVVTGVSQGDTVITVTTEDGGFTDTIDVHVNAPVSVESVIVTPSEITIPVIDSYYFELKAEVFPENASFQTITWTSSDRSILEVSSAGMLKGVAPGTAEAIATTPEGIQGRCTVTVLSQDDYPGVLSLNFHNITTLPFSESEIALGNGDGELILFKKTPTATPAIAYAVGYSFIATPGQEVCFRSDWRSDEHLSDDRFDTYMTLVDSEGNILAYNDDDSDNRPYSKITYTFSDNETYYIVIVPYYFNKAGVIRFFAQETETEVTPQPTQTPVTPSPTPITQASTFTYNDLNVQAGETFTVTIALNNYHNDCNLLDMDITYDPSLFTYVSHTGGTLYQQAYSANIHLEETGVISTSFYGGDDEWSGEELPIYVSGPCTIATITFMVNSNAAGGVTALGFNINWFEDGDEEPLNYIAEPGVITIENDTTPIPVQDITWDFEEDPFENGWIAVDSNDDSYSWEWKFGVSALPAHSGSGMVASFSCINGFVGDISPDNWLISPAFIAGNTLSFYMSGQDSTYYMDPVGIYVTTDGGQTWSGEIEYFICESYYVQRTVDLSEYAGQAIQVAFRHYNVFGQYAVSIDDVVASGAGEAPETPTPVPPTPTPTPVPADALDNALNVEGGTLHFEPEGNYTFVVEEDCAVNNNQSVNSSDAIIIVQNHDFSSGAVLRFKYKVSSEYNYDKLQVKADSSIVFQSSGDNASEWLEGSVVIPVGTQIVRFVYHKDISGNEGEDSAWLDDIAIGEIVPVSGVEFTEEFVSIPLGRTYQLEWNILPEDADLVGVIFEVDNSEIATVSPAGLVTGRASGDAVVTITTVDGGFTDTINIHVEDYVEVEQVIINHSTLTIPVTGGATEKLTATVLPENATNITLTWESSDSSVCTVAGGTLRGIAPGTAIITATSVNGVYGSCEVTVVPANEFAGIFDIEYTSIDSMPYFNGEVGVGIGYGTPIFYQRNPQSASVYSYGTGFSYTARAGEVVRFRTNWYNGTEDADNRIDTYVTLYNEAGEILTFSDDDTNNRPFSIIEYTFQAAGTYYFVIAPYNFQNTNGTGLVQVIAERLSEGVTPGDVDGDGIITVEDALLVSRQAMGLVALDGNQLLAADFNNDSYINFDDVLLIMRRALSLA